eukprot:scpid70002/ scgid6723/ Phosphoserine phosphatase; L-3-phosphoserine phosphatase; O-phosphoserine phosphohydrolase
MVLTEKERVLEVWQNADAVCFDVDSTVIREEGLDHLAAYLGKGEAVAALTRAAMGGGMTFRTSLQKRMDLCKPSLAQVESFVDKSGFTLTDGIQEIVEALHERGTHVYMVSGGFSHLIEPIADQLHIPHENIFCNVMQFDERGNYIGFDLNQPTSRAGGKPTVVQQLIDRHGYKNVVMVGDGATDLEASPPAHAFIGFGGNCVRSRVEAEAPLFVMDFGELLEAL